MGSGTAGDSKVINFSEAITIEYFLLIIKLLMIDYCLLIIKNGISNNQ
jgi:hypothetical protein